MQGFVNEIAFDVICADGRQVPVLVNIVEKRDLQGAPWRITSRTSTQRTGEDMSGSWQAIHLR